MMQSSEQSLESLVQAEAIRQIYGTMTSALYSTAIASVFVALAVSRITPTHVYLAWLGAMYLQLGGRWLLLYTYRHSQPDDSALPRWGLAATIGAMVSGVMWGSSIAVLVPPQAYEYQFFLTLVTAVLATTAGVASATHLPSLFGFYLPVMLPLPYYMLHDPGELGLMTAVMLLVYIPIYIGFIVRIHKTLLQSIRLRLEKGHLAEELAERITVAETATQEKSRFLAAASHDLRQPMHALALFVESLKMQPLEAAPARLVEKIGHAIAAMEGLFHALLDVSRLDAGIVKPNPVAFPVQTLLDRMALSFAGIAENRQLRFSVSPCKLWVESDPLLCEQILRNLVANAIRYTDHGGVLLGCRRYGNRLRIEIHDSGPGIPLAAQQEIFKEFVQLHNPERDRNKGLGLGLAIVRRMAELLDARLELVSVVGHGSLFSFSLPLAEAQQETGALSVLPEEETLSGRVIAVIDDESQIRDAMLELLSGWGIAVISADSGEALIARVNRDGKLPDALICDYRLRDGISGIAAILAVREEFNTDFPALLLTGDTAPDRLLEAEQSGLPLMHKPAQPRLLKRMLAALLRDTG